MKSMDSAKDQKNNRPVSTTLRLDPEIKRRLDQHVAILRIAGITKTLVEVAEEALADYLDGFDEAIADAASGAVAGDEDTMNKVLVFNRDRGKRFRVRQPDGTADEPQKRANG